MMVIKRAAARILHILWLGFLSETSNPKPYTERYSTLHGVVKDSAEKFCLPMRLRLFPGLDRYIRCNIWKRFILLMLFGEYVSGNGQPD